MRGIANHIAVAFDNAMLYHIANTDELTGLFSNRHFRQAISRRHALFRQYGEKLALLMIDVDEFKAFNDRHGHAAGDRCLVEVATALTSNLRRAGDLLARYGGEEFAAIIPETTVAAASRIAEALRSAVEALRLPHGGSPVAPHVTVSIGAAAVYPAAGGDAAALVAAADAALYQAGEPRNSVRGLPAVDGDRDLL